MRYYTATVSRYHTFFVTPNTTEVGIRLGYKHVCNVLGMHEDKRKRDRTAAEQRAVSEYGRFIRQCLSKGHDRWNTVFTVSDLNLGRVVTFVYLDQEYDGSLFFELDNLAHKTNFHWKPPFERLCDMHALARFADLSAASDTLQGDALRALVDGLPKWEPLPFKSGNPR